MRIAICDDNRAFRSELAQLVKTFLQQSGRTSEVAVYANGTDLLEDARRTGGFDIYILDVLMPLFNGIDLGIQLRELDPDSKIIYLSISPDYAIRATRTRMWEYLLKPVKQEELFSSLEEAFVSLSAKRENGMVVKIGQSSIRVSFDSILYAMPVFYIHIFATLRHQYKLYETQQQDSILQVQVASLRSRIDEFSAANELFHEERHDFRHKMHTIAALAEKGDLDAIVQTAKDYVQTLTERSLERYCDHRILDVVLASYLEWAKRKGIRVATKLTFPEVLPVNETELATALANALENAIHACEKVDASERYIEVKSIIHPCFMVQVRNSFDGTIAFDEEGIPLSAKKGHGFGTRSIVTFCNKYGTFYEFKADEKDFTLLLMFNP